MNSKNYTTLSALKTKHCLEEASCIFSGKYAGNVDNAKDL